MHLGATGAGSIEFFGFGSSLHVHVVNIGNAWHARGWDSTGNWTTGRTTIDHLKGKHLIVASFVTAKVKWTRSYKIISPYFYEPSLSFDYPIYCIRFQVTSP
jgi:hypothetical protein